MDSIGGSHCVVTGAGGFIGAGLCRRLVAEGARVTGLDADPGLAERVEATNAAFALCDVTDAGAVASALSGADYVVNAAAIVSDWGRMDDFVEVNVRGTRNVLDAARDGGARRLVHLSSIATFGYLHGAELDEDANARPCGNPYIDTKGASDELVRMRAERGDPVITLRPGDVYGPGSTPWAIRPLQAIRSRQFALIDGGRGLILPVYVDDLVEAIVLALTAPGASGSAITVWDGEAVTAAEFFGHYARMLDRKIPSLPAPIVAGGAAVQELVATLTGRPPAFSRDAMMFVSRRAKLSNRRALELLGWRPRIDLEEGMRRTEAWFRAEGLL